MKKYTLEAKTGSMRMVCGETGIVTIGNSSFAFYVAFHRNDQRLMRGNYSQSEYARWKYSRGDSIRSIFRIIFGFYRRN